MKDASDRPLGLPLVAQKKREIVEARLRLTKEIYSIRAGELKSVTKEELYFWSGPLSESVRRKVLAKISQTHYDANKRVERAVIQFEEVCRKYGGGR